MKKAVITGISGQDGSYLAEHLLGLDYEVHGIVRRNSVPEHQESRIDHLEGKIETHYGDVLDQGSLGRVLKHVQPDEVYNLAAQSHVRISFDCPQFTVQSNALGVLNLLEEVRLTCPDARVYQASSSEMFGNSVDDDDYQRLTTPMVPTSPYGCAKVFAYNLVRHYRRAYGMFAANGVLFNHETVAANTPMFVKNSISEEIDIKPISEIVSDDLSGSPTSPIVDESVSEYQSGSPCRDVLVWDKCGWTKVTYASGYPHQIDDDNKNPKIINARKGVAMTTGSHIFMMKNGDEIPAEEMRTEDKVGLCDFPEEKPVASLENHRAFLLGMMAGDGHIDARVNKGKFTNKIPSVRDMFLDLWEKDGGRATYYPTRSGFTGEVIGQLSLSAFPEWIKKIDIYNRRERTVFGHRLKRVPRIVLNANRKTQLEFLRGYNLCDGLKSNLCTYEFKNFKTNSATLALGLLYLIHRVSGQDYNVTIEESDKHGETQYYYSINLLSDRMPSADKIEMVESYLRSGLSQRAVSELAGVSRSFIRGVERGKGLVEHPLKRCAAGIKKIISVPDYSGWFYDLETESGTFHCGVGQLHVHNSPRRGSNFVTNKVVKGAVRIKLGLQKTLEMGNMDSFRDWGHSKDYVRAMHLILNHSKPDDFVVATGQTHSIRELCAHVFGALGLDYKDFVGQNPRYMRPEELKYLRGDSTRARRILGWVPEYTFETLLNEMIEHWMSVYKGGHNEGKSWITAR